MKMILSAIFLWLSFRIRRRVSLEMEIIALRHQIKVLERRHHKRYRKKPWFSDSDKVLWAWLYKIWPPVREFMILLKPRQVVSWHREGFCFYWTMKLKYRKPPRKTAPALIVLIREMSTANPLWGNLRIRAELLKLGIRVGHSTINRYRIKGPRTPSPGWRVFLQTHMRETVAVDMFIVITVTFRLIYAMIILGYDRRRILHCAVTANPTDDWLSNQIGTAFSNQPIPRFLVRDRDALFKQKFHDQIRKLGIEEVVTAPHSPWQNSYVERAIGSIRRECLNHVIVVNERHLRRILSSYTKYYNESRTHMSLGYDSPIPRPIEPPGTGTIIAVPEVGGLHHRYSRRRAA